MASEEIRKKWGTIFMGDREASVDELNAMQKPLLREKQQKEETEDYMDRVRQRAADRAREILGAAYTERQKVLDEAKAEALAIKKQALAASERLKNDGETARKLAETELAKAQAEKEAAVKLRDAAHEEGFQAGMEQASKELHEFRAELGQSLAVLLRAIERERKIILQNWREDLATLTQCAVQAGTGYILEKEHEAILRNLVFRALDLLENRSIVSMRVNPADESTVADMFRAARERAPELKQWIVTGDANIERGGIVADSGSGSVDLQRRNFQELVDGILCHLGLPDQELTVPDQPSVADLVEREVASIAGMTPEIDQPEPIEPEVAQTADAGLATEENPQEITAETPVDNGAQESADATQTEEIEQNEQLISEPLQETTVTEEYAEVDPTLAELEEELFPVEENPAPVSQPDQPDPKTLAEGGFL